ncbi:serine hydrolase domain-containing protein [Marinifilum caeruleilacunae]|uniref:Class A beta-lactamase-related serine hydrolase n=1 Tax=Marinifilum caeruleilacunae TaxID=2499076 RepID=A0ABX1WSJ2_9BACT|nr:serine hydrolase domain-containing protein [Marinifilum caeruleilacunae]NOU59043.1 class A beta-lactamase-related serine hydrolase [Marinifilum caeruleilacunae]
MIVRRIFSFLIVLFLVFFDRNFSFSKQGTEAIEFDSSIEAVSHRISNTLSDCVETERAERLINRFLKKWEVAGATVAVVKDQKLLYAKGFGYADLENEIKVEPSHIFRIASVSKLITATAIMKLQEEGKLKMNDYVFGEHGILNDSIYSKIKDKRSKRITVEHLLRHSAGYSSKYGDPMFLPLSIAKKMKVEPPISAETTIQFALSRRLHFTPGSRGGYSNLGYVMLEKVVEKASGQDYEEYVKKQILNPAGIFDMHLGKSLETDHYANEVKYYEQSNAIKVSAFDGSGKTVFRSNGGNNIEALGGAGGWVASAAELMKFLLAIDGDDSHPDILSKKSIAYMTTPNKNGHSPIGWKGTRTKTWWRTGTLAGSSALMKHQVDGYSFVIVTNASTWRGSDFTRDLNVLMRRVLRSVKEWPERDLFNHFEARPDRMALDKLPKYQEWS